MKKNMAATILIFLISSSLGFSQPEEKDKLNLEVPCYDMHHVVRYGQNAIGPKFILCIRNNGDFPVNLDQDVILGHAGDEDENDITFELYFLSGKDTVNVLKKVIFRRGYTTRHHNKVTIESTAGHFVEFTDLSSLYFHKSGRYKIRFTLLKKYAEKYMTMNTSTDWIYFDVDVPQNSEL